MVAKTEYALLYTYDQNMIRMTSASTTHVRILSRSFVALCCRAYLNRLFFSAVLLVHKYWVLSYKYKYWNPVLLVVVIYCNAVVLY